MEGGVRERLWVARKMQDSNPCQIMGCSVNCDKMSLRSRATELSPVASLWPLAVMLSRSWHLTGVSGTGLVSALPFTWPLKPYIPRGTWWTKGRAEEETG